MLQPVTQLPILLDRADKLASQLDRQNWAGPDPYDALLSPLSKTLTGKRQRQAFIQAVKRSPVNVRGALRIPPVRTAAATGLGATACSRLGDHQEWRERAQRLGSWTAEAQMTGRYRGLWGYEFDVQTRWGFYPCGEPNVVATTFAADGCLAAGTLPVTRADALARALLHHLYADPHFTYTPTSDVLIHNANLMTASLALRLSTRPGISSKLAMSLVKAARSATEATLAHQRSDGSWPYGEAASLGWIDGFHTGYVLLRLDEIMTCGMPEVSDALQRGARFYFSRLFDGARPLYSCDEDRRRDGNNAATALALAAWGSGLGYVSSQFPERVFEEINREGWYTAMLTPGSGWSTRRLPSPRWLGAPLLDAMSLWIATLR